MKDANSREVRAPGHQRHDSPMWLFEAAPHTGCRQCLMITHLMKTGLDSQARPICCGKYSYKGLSV